MQTFLPIATTNFEDIAKMLDRQRLNKQALEGWQILMVNLELDPDGNNRKPKGWVNHPAVKMWKGHERTLLRYILAMTDEWVARGYRTTIGDKAVATMIAGLKLRRTVAFEELPAWMENQEKFLAIAKSHRLALLTKNYEWYSQFDWHEDDGVSPTSYTYVWE
jgi:hypothetical protein